MSMQRTAAGYANETARDTRRLESAATDLHALLERSRSLTARLDSLEARAFGVGTPESPKGVGNPPEAVPNGTLTSIDTLVRKLIEQTEVQEGLITKLESMV